MFWRPLELQLIQSTKPMQIIDRPFETKKKIEGKRLEKKKARPFPLVWTENRWGK